MGGYNSDAAIQAIVFQADGGFDITYAERYDFHPKGTVVRQLMVPAGVVPPSAIEDVRDALKELLDLALVERADDPAERLSRR